MTDLGQCIQVALSHHVSTRDRIAALHQIAEMGGPRDAAMLMRIVLAHKKAIGRVAIAFEQVLFGVQGDVTKTAAETVSRLMNKVEAAEWTSLYSTFRNVSLRREDVACLDQFPTDQAIHLLGVATLNQNGYVREEATGRLGAIRSPEVLHIFSCALRTGSQRFAQRLSVFFTLRSNGGLQVVFWIVCICFDGWSVWSGST